MRYDVTMQESNTGKIIIFIVGFLALAFGGLAIWALLQYNQERNTVQEQVNAAVDEAREDQQEKAEAQFKEEQKRPFRTYTAPDVFGGIEILFPKNWNVYVEDTTSGNPQIDLYIHPNQVRVQNGEAGPVAFRMQLVDKLFEEATSQYRNETEKGEMKAKTVEVSGIKGTRYEGKVRDDFEGSLVAVPYRDKTLLLWTESNNFKSDFDNILGQTHINR